MSKTYFRGDSRDSKEIFKNGFERWYPSSRPHKYFDLFFSDNAISLSSEIRSAAFFPHCNLQETYVYIVRDEKGTFYNLYGESLKKIFSSEVRDESDRLTNLSWANEYVSEDKIESKNILGCLKIKRNLEKDPFDTTPNLVCVSFKIIKYLPNPKFGSKLTNLEKILIKEIENSILEKRILISNFPKKSQSYLLKTSSHFFHKLSEEIDIKSVSGGFDDIKTIEMIYAASKAKFIQKEKNCHEKIHKLLEAIFIEINSPGRCSKEITKIVNSYFSSNKIFDKKSISDLEGQVLENIFFSFSYLWDENNLSKFFPSLDPEISEIFESHKQILENNSPQLPSMPPSTSSSALAKFSIASTSSAGEKTKEEESAATETRIPSGKTRG